MTIWNNLAFAVPPGSAPLQRDAHLRADAAAIAALRALPGARVLPFWRGKPLFRGDGIGLLPPGHPVLAAGRCEIFLGFPGDDTTHTAPVFACDISDWEPGPEQPAMPGSFFDPTEQRHPDLLPEDRFAELRGMMARLAPGEAEIAATARALMIWHANHGFCAVCGAASVVARAGWQRSCTACAAQHFPRCDPVVIMLVTRGNRVLLGRSPGWPEGMYSCLAGFMEPGETIEAAVRREVAEETGVAVGAVRYVASQPWPFPSSLMFGCAAEAESDAITPDPEEIEDALWLTREELADVFAGQHPLIRAPRRGAIAGHLLALWLADRLE